jgi:DNA-binding PadR family transcriptional regulator
MTPAELAVLSLIVEEPRHGYAIGTVIDERGMREWVDLGMSSIYHVLGRLEGGAMIEGRLGSESGGPARKVFHTTPAGRDAAAEGIRAAIAEPRRSGSLFLLGLANLPALPPGVVRSALLDRMSALERERSRLEAKRRELGGSAAHVDAMFGYTDALIDAEINWLEGFEEALP